MNIQDIAGVSAGVVNAVVGHPLDTIKVRMQSEGVQGKYRNTWHCIRSTFVHEGVSGFYKGIAPVLFGKGLIHGIVFGVFDCSSKRIGPLLDGPGTPPSKTTTLLSGITAGLITSSVVTPIDQVKTLMQTQYDVNVPNAMKNSFRVLQAVHKDFGITGLYRNLIPTLWEMSFLGIYFLAFTQSTAFLRSLRSPSNSVYSESIISFVSGGFSGMCLVSSMCPADVVKNRMMTKRFFCTPEDELQYGTMRRTIKTIFQKEGIKGFYYGLVPSLIRVFPASGATFLTYSMISGYGKE